MRRPEATLDFFRPMYSSKCAWGLDIKLSAGQMATPGSLPSLHRAPTWLPRRFEASHAILICFWKGVRTLGGAGTNAQMPCLGGSPSLATWEVVLVMARASPRRSMEVASS